MESSHPLYYLSGGRIPRGFHINILYTHTHFIRKPTAFPAHRSLDFIILTAEDMGQSRIPLLCKILSCLP